LYCTVCKPNGAMLQPYTAFCIAGNRLFPDFVHCPGGGGGDWNMTFWKLDLFPSSGEEEDSYSVVSLRKIRFLKCFSLFNRGQ
jgi:hypothetical protein